MDLITDIADLRIAASRLDASNLADTTRARLEQAIREPSPVLMIADAAETLYAARAELNDEQRVLCASLAAFAGTWALHGLDAAARGLKIARAIRRDAGELQPGTGDPRPDPDFLPPPPLPGMPTG